MEFIEPLNVNHSLSEESPVDVNNLISPNKFNLLMHYALRTLCKSAINCPILISDYSTVWNAVSRLIIAIKDNDLLTNASYFNDKECLAKIKSAEFYKLSIDKMILSGLPEKELVDLLQGFVHLNPSTIFVIEGLHNLLLRKLATEDGQWLPLPWFFISALKKGEPRFITIFSVNDYKKLFSAHPFPIPFARYCPRIFLDDFPIDFQSKYKSIGTEVSLNEVVNRNF